VILVAAFLLVVALGLLAVGLAQGSAALQWGSFAASALAALVLAVGELRRRRVAAEVDRDAAPEGGRQADPAAVPWTAGTAPAPSPAELQPPVEWAGQPAAAPPVEPPPVEPWRADHQPADSPPADPPPAGPPPVDVPTGAHAGQPITASGPSTGAHAAAPVLGPDGEPPAEVVEVTDLLLVLDLTDEVLVVDEHPRFHLAGCPHLDGVQTIPVPLDEARTDGFTPCGTCAPDRNLADRERARRTGA
jgi:hypothetical protein